MTTDHLSGRWSRICVVSVALVTGGCGKANKAKQPVSQAYLSKGKVTLTIPASWIEQRRITNGNVEVIQFEVPDKATENTPDSANAVITVEPHQAGVTVTNFGDARLFKGRPEEGYVVLTDFPVDAMWRTTLSLGHQGSTPYAIMDRFGVHDGVMVAFRVGHPVLSNNGNELAQSVSNFNFVAASLKIGGSNFVDSEMRIDNGSVWLRHFKDPRTNWMSGTGMVYRRFQPEQKP